MDIKVELGERSYVIKIKKDSFKEAGNWVSSLWQTKQVAIITDENVDKIYGEELVESLKKENFVVYKIVVPAGEESKSFLKAQEIYEKLVDLNFSRKDGIIALGGGVVGDLAGFIASTYKRGISLLQIPTTLLAQVDSSVGGKTALNLEQGKNLVGTFYQPEGVLIDPLILKTLPIRRLREGLAEVIKYGAIADEKLFEELEDMQGEEDFLKHSEKVIATCCLIKKMYVEQDERDTGLRFQLNFGHTIGHGVEQVSHYKSYTHGEAVAVGMNKITEITEKQGETALGTKARLQKLLQKFSLPLEYTPWDKEKLVEAIKRDKKGDSKEIRMVRLEKIGQAKLFSVALDDVINYL